MQNDKRNGISRRDFLKNAGIVAGAAAAFSALAPLKAMAEEGEQNRITQELPIPETTAAPEKTEYECDVLVIGGGFAGLNAAMAARQSGQSVVLIDKGRPGYSGLSPWPSSFRFFDESLGDDAQAFRDCMMRGSEYIGNMDWYEMWIQESRETYDRLMEWEILTQFPKASDAGDYFDNLDYIGYREAFSDHDRRTKWVKLLNENDIEFAEYTMINDIIQQDGKVAGAVGFHVPSGAMIVCHAKSIVMCMGGGCYKPSGYPVGGVTFDGEYIGYKLGLPIAGKEFDDFHLCVSWAPGNAFINNNWTYLENIWICGGDVTPDTAATYADNKGKTMVLDRVTKAVSGLAVNDGTSVEDMSTMNIERKGGSLSERPDDPRTGKENDTMFKGDIYGAAVGFGGHLSAGIFCGLEVTDGFTGISGLYCAGDGMNASAPTGAAYPCGVGFTSSFISIQGTHAGKAAAEYAASVELEKISEENLMVAVEEIMEPLYKEKGFDPNWARDMLQSIMAPYWVHIVKTEETLSGALSQVLFMRDSVVPKLMAYTPHDLRLCHEMKHKVLSAEMKLRAGLARQESRGLHYRADFPYRDDENFLCYMTVQKSEDGEMVINRVPVKDEWKGDLSQDYAERYGYFFPGEREAMGLPEEESEGGWGGNN